MEGGEGRADIEKWISSIARYTSQESWIAGLRTFGQSHIALGGAPAPVLPNHRNRHALPAPLGAGGARSAGGGGYRDSLQRGDRGGGMLPPQRPSAFSCSVPVGTSHSPSAPPLVAISSGNPCTPSATGKSETTNRGVKPALHRHPTAPWQDHSRK